MIVGWLIVALVFGGYLGLIYFLLRSPDDPEDDGPAFVAPDPDKTITLAAIADWYQLWYDASATDRLLERAAELLAAAV